jgi:hypothetical protein
MADEAVAGEAPPEETLLSGKFEVDVEQLRIRAGTFAVESDYVVAGLLRAEIGGVPVLLRALHLTWNTKARRWRVIVDIVPVEVD